MSYALRPARTAALLAALAAATLSTGCLPASAPIRASAAEAPAFLPEVFFAGRTEGRGVLTIRGKRPGAIRVESRGAAGADGGFRLDQTITFADRRVSRRTWHMRALGGGRYASTLTPDARGSVEAEASGSRFHIRYRMGRATVMDQWLTLRPGGQVADNVATVRMMGVPWARLSETITRVGE